MIPPFHGIALLNQKKLTRYIDEIRATFLDIQAGMPGCHVEKLQGAPPLWSARYNDEERMLFTYIQWKGKTYACVLDYLPHHGYDRSYALHHSVARKQYIEKCKEALAALALEGVIDAQDLEVHEKNLALATSPPPAPPLFLAETIDEKNAEMISSASPILLTPYGKKTWIQLCQEQEEVLATKQFPFLLTGPAGTGKSSVIFAWFHAYLDAFSDPDQPGAALPSSLYLTRSARLAEDMQKRWQESAMPEGYAEAMHAMTLETFLEKHSPLIQRSEPTPQNKNRFVSWYNQLITKKHKSEEVRALKKIAESFKSHKASDIYDLLRQENTLPDSLKEKAQLLRDAYRGHLLTQQQQDAALFGTQWADEKLFLQWYAQQKKLQIADITPHALYEEFKICCGFNVEEYVALGDRQAATKVKRPAIYSLYQAYQTYLASIGHLDALLPSEEILASIPPLAFHRIALDEAQDLSTGWYHWLTKIKTSEVAFFCDSHQGSGSPLFTHLYESVPSQFALRIMHRCPPLVVAVINESLKRKHHILGGKSDKHAADQIQAMDDNTHMTPPFLIDRNAIDAAHPLLAEGAGSDTFVITDAAHVEEAKKVFKTEFVLTPEETRGLQSKTVILYFGEEKKVDPHATWGESFFAQVAKHLSKNPLPVTAEGEAPKPVYRAKSHIAQENELGLHAGFNHLYTALSRTYENLVVVHHNAPKTQQFFASMGDTLHPGPLPTDLAGLTDKNSTEDWIHKVKELSYAGHGQVAYRICCTKIVPDGNAEEIMRLFGAEFSIEGEGSARYFKPFTRARAERAEIEPALEMLETKEEGGSSKQIHIAPTPDIPVEPLSYEKQFPVHAAVKTGLPSSLKKCFKKIKSDAEKQALLDTKDPEGNTPLHLAAQQGYARISLLFRISEDIDSLRANQARILQDTNQAGETVLMRAVQAEHVDTVKQLLDIAEQGPLDPFIATCKNASTWISADSEIGRCLQEACKNAEEKRKEIEPYIAELINAAHQNQCSKMKPILKKVGVEIDAVNVSPTQECTALQIAAQESSLKAMTLLLESKAQVNTTSQNGHTALHAAAAYGKRSAVEKLLASKANIDATAYMDNLTALHMAAREGNTATATVLLAHKAQVNFNQDTTGGTPLYIAVQESQKEVAEILLKNKAEVNVARKLDGSTPLHQAADRGHSAVVALLLDHNAKVDAITKNDNRTALYIAVQKDNNAVVDTLLKNNANTNIPHSNEITPLHVVARNGNVVIAEKLLGGGANIDPIAPTASGGSTPLDLAVLNGHTAVVDILLEKKAKADRANSHGLTPLHRAVKAGHVAIVEKLLAEGADIHAVDANGDTPLSLAKQLGLKEMLLAHQIAKEARHASAAASDLEQTTQQAQALAQAYAPSPSPPLPSSSIFALISSGLSVFDSNPSSSHSAAAVQAQQNTRHA